MTNVVVPRVRTNKERKAEAIRIISSKPNIVKNKNSIDAYQEYLVVVDICNVLNYKTKLMKEQTKKNIGTKIAKSMVANNYKKYKNLFLSFYQIKVILDQLLLDEKFNDVRRLINEFSLYRHGQDVNKMNKLIKLSIGILKEMNKETLISEEKFKEFDDNLEELNDDLENTEALSNIHPDEETDKMFEDVDRELNSINLDNEENEEISEVIDVESKKNESTSKNEPKEESLLSRVRRGDNI